MAQTAIPLVSMIVVSYNHSPFVVETLESVKAQTYKATQLIIVDDCSTDDSIATIDRWLHENGMDCAFVRHHENRGICRSLNDALTLATGKYVSMVAADDVWLPDKIAQQVVIMESQPAYVGVLYSDAFQMDEHGHSLPDMFIAAHRKLSEMPQGQVLEVLLGGNFIPGMTTLIRRSCYDVVGLYDEHLPWEDWDMWMRIAPHYSFIYSPTPSAKYRLHDKSFSHSNRAVMLKGSFKTCLKHFGLTHLNEKQRSLLFSSLLNVSDELYRQGDDDSSCILSALWQATGNKRVGWMYRFAKSGISYRNWQRANTCRLSLRRVRDMVLGAMRIL